MRNHITLTSVFPIHKAVKTASPSGRAVSSLLTTPQIQQVQNLLLVPSCSVTSTYALDCSPPGSPSMGFFRQEYWSGLPFLSPGDPPRPRDRTCISCVLCAAGRFFTCWAISSPTHSSRLINVPSFFSLMVSPSSSPVLTLAFLSQLQLCYLLTLLFYQVCSVFSCCSESTGSPHPGMEPGLLHGRQTRYRLSHQEASPILSHHNPTVQLLTIHFTWKCLPHHFTWPSQLRITPGLRRTTSYLL